MSPHQDLPTGAPPCPRCSLPLVAGGAWCPHCALPLTGPVAGELWSVDQQIVALRGRRTVLLERLASGPADGDRPAAPAGPAVTVPASPRRPERPGAAGPYAPPVVLAALRPAPRRRLGAQQLLLGAGVLLVAVAAVVFAAVVWAAIGVLGQAAVLLAVCAAAAAAARLSARRGLGSSAEALAVLAVLVLVVDVVAARSLDLLGLGAADADACALGGLLVVVGAAAAADRLLRAAPRSVGEAPAPDDEPATRAPRTSRPVAFAWAAVVGTAGVPTLLARAVDGGALTWSAAALVLAVAGTVAAPAVGRRGRGLATTALGVAGAHLGAGVLALLGVVLAHDSRARLLEAAAELALLAVAAALVAVRARPARPVVARAARATSWTGAGGVLLSLSLLGGSTALVALAGGLAAAAAGALLLRRPVPWVALAVVQAVALGALLLEPLVVAVQGSSGPGWARPVAWALLAVSAALTAQRRPTPSGTGEGAAACWTAVCAAAALVAAGVLPAPVPRDARTLVVLGVATALLVLAARAVRRGATAREAVLVGGWILGVGVALALAGGPGASGVDPSTVLAVAGASALAFALVRSRGPWCVAGAVLLSAAWWSLLDGTAVSTPEAWTLPPALLALAVGVVAWGRAPRAPSWQVLGPGLVLGLAPSAVLSCSGDELLRPSLTVLAAAAVCAAGVLRSWQAPLVVGAGAAVLVALGQLGPYAVGAPLWASLGAAGALLLVLAVRIEQARRDAARTVSWVRALQ